MPRPTRQELKEGYFEKFLSILAKYGWSTKITIDDYENSYTFYEVFCPEGHSRKKNLCKLTHQLKHGGEKMICLDCNDGIDFTTKFQIERRKAVFGEFLKCASARGFKMLSTWEDYLTNLTTLELICPSEHLVKNNWSNFQQDILGCKQCSYDSKLTLSYDDVKKHVEAMGWKLHSKSFRRVDKHLKLECECGNHLKKTFHQLSQNKGLKCRLCSQSRIFHFSSGRKEYVQGYENRTIEELLAGPDDRYGEIREDDMVIGEENIPPVPYVYEGKQHLYYPDLWIPSRNLYIETKSWRNYDLWKEINESKFEAVCLSGYNFECWFFDGRGLKMRIKYELMEDSIVIIEGDWEIALGGESRGAYPRGGC